jgi:hypothetical protein
MERNVKKIQNITALNSFLCENILYFNSTKNKNLKFSCIQKMISIVDITYKNEMKL